jgi:segregation and condensation protein B
MRCRALHIAPLSERGLLHIVIAVNEQELKNLVEAVLLAGGRPLTVADILALFEEYERPTSDAVHHALQILSEEYESRGIELKKVASGYRVQARRELAPWLSRLWEKRPTRYSRALLETLALIAYRQPVTRGEIEEIRGVSVSTPIIKTLLERDWVRVVGHRDVPGRPALYGTTPQFLDDFNLESLDELPTLSEFKDIDPENGKLQLKLFGAEEAAQPEIGEDVQRKE